jgi:antitoxin MazE
MQVSKWGNSLAIRLPAAVVEALNLKAGDDINITVAGKKEFAVERKPTREEMFERIMAMGRPLPPGFKFDREEANARR